MWQSGNRTKDGNVNRSVANHISIMQRIYQTWGRNPDTSRIVKTLPKDRPHQTERDTAKSRRVMAEWQRTNTCGELREEHDGQIVTLNGWVLITRNYPKQTFVDLRDRYGLTQIVFEIDDAEMFKNANELAREWVVSITGLVRNTFAISSATALRARSKFLPRSCAS